VSYLRKGRRLKLSEEGEKVDSGDGGRALQSDDVGCGLMGAVAVSPD
jgi:hypothetical protein